MPFVVLEQDGILLLLKHKQTVDLNIIADVEIRTIVAGYPREGGARD
jgi:hypothetical protein